MNSPAKLERIILFILFAPYLLSGCRFFSASDRAGQHTILGEARVGPLVQRVTIAGTLTPERSARIAAPYNGYVKKMFVKIGDKVSEGAPLVTIVQSLDSSEGQYPLRSPIRGTVVQVLKKVGDFVKEGDEASALLQIEDAGDFLLEAKVPEIDRVKVAIGQKAVVQFSALVGKTFHAQIEEVALASERPSRTSRSENVEFEIVLKMLDKDPQMLSGMSSIIDVSTLERNDVLQLRHEFVQKDGNRSFVILESGEERDLNLGVQNEEAVEIIDGLKAGERVRQVDFMNLKLAE